MASRSAIRFGLQGPRQKPHSVSRALLQQRRLPPSRDQALRALRSNATNMLSKRHNPELVLRLYRSDGPPQVDPPVTLRAYRGQWFADDPNVRGRFQTLEEPYSSFHVFRDDQGFTLMPLAADHPVHLNGAPVPFEHASRLRPGDLLRFDSLGPEYRLVFDPPSPAYLRNPPAYEFWAQPYLCLTLSPETPPRHPDTARRIRTRLPCTVVGHGPQAHALIMEPGAPAEVFCLWLLDGVFAASDESGRMLLNGLPQASPSSGFLRRPIRTYNLLRLFSGDHLDLPPLGLRYDVSFESPFAPTQTASIDSDTRR